MTKIVRVLEAFERNGDAFVFEIPLADISVQTLKQIFHFDTEDAACVVDQRVEPQHVQALQAYVGRQIDLDRYDWFYSTYAE
jgi:hypothetical protein